MWVRSGSSGRPCPALTRQVDPSQVPVDPIVLYGSEMEALHVASALPPSLQCRTVVISPSGKWLCEWGPSLKRLGSQYVRSPITQHPGAAPGAFKDWIEKTGRQAVRGCVCLFA